MDELNIWLERFISWGVILCLMLYAGQNRPDKSSYVQECMRTKTLAVCEAEEARQIVSMSRL